MAAGGFGVYPGAGPTYGLPAADPTTAGVTYRRLEVTGRAGRRL